MPFAVRILIAAAAALILYLMAVRLVRAMMRPGLPDEPDLSNLRPVDRRYRCGICGAEVTMTAAPGEEEIDAPRHCKDDMILVDQD
jgi:DNA-directed RNA polymerase subunit RPC12/RpoP